LLTAEREDLACHGVAQPLARDVQSSACAGSTALANTVAGPKPAEYVNSSRARLFVPSSRSATRTVSTTAPA
jgi:hypothetical protein